MNEYNAEPRDADAPLPKRNVKQYAHNGIDGCVVQRVARQTGTLVGLYHAEQAGMDDCAPWVTVCEVHGNCVNHDTMATARDWMADPQTWCEECRAPSAGDREKK